MVSIYEYKNIIFELVDKIEIFYQLNSVRILPTNELNRNGYIAFWNE